MARLFFMFILEVMIGTLLGVNFWVAVGVTALVTVVMFFILYICAKVYGGLTALSNAITVSAAFEIWLLSVAGISLSVIVPWFFWTAIAALLLSFVFPLEV